MKILTNYYSVIFKDSYWHVQNNAEPFPQGTFVSKLEAVGYGTMLARTAHTMLKVYKMDGILQDTNDYRSYRGPNYYE